MEIKRIDDDTFEYYGYRVQRDGTIISPYGNELKGYHFTYPRSHVSIVIEGKDVKTNRARLIYELFSGHKITRKEVLRFKDEDQTNVAFDNLYLIDRKEYYKLHEGYNQKKLDKETIKKIKRMYNNKGKKISIRKLCEMYDCSLLTMQKALGVYSTKMEKV